MVDKTWKEKCSTTSSSPRSTPSVVAPAQVNKSESIKSLLSTPTNNFGLGLLFKKF